MSEESVNNGIPLPEAGGVAWTEMLTAGGQRVNMTARGHTLIEAVDELNKAVNYAHQTYGWRGSGSVKQANYKKASNTPVKRNVEKPAEELSGEMGTSEIVQYEVSTRADGKGELSLYESGHKYPDLKIVGWDVSSLSKFLSDVQSSSGKPWEQAFTDGEQGMVHWLVTWEYSDKLKRSGKPYQNVKKIEPYNKAP